MPDGAADTLHDDDIIDGDILHPFHMSTVLHLDTMDNFIPVEKGQGITVD